MRSLALITAALACLFAAPLAAQDSEFETVDLVFDVSEELAFNVFPDLDAITAGAREFTQFVPTALDRENFAIPASLTLASVHFDVPDDALSGGDGGLS